MFCIPNATEGDGAKSLEAETDKAQPITPSHKAGPRPCALSVWHLKADGKHFLPGRAALPWRLDAGRVGWTRSSNTLSFCFPRHIKKALS